MFLSTRTKIEINMRQYNRIGNLFTRRNLGGGDTPSAGLDHGRGINVMQ